ncbi:hypothetical protein QQZ08_001819 [Neonectria magnoliae]|uniref:Kinetochore protein fta7 n=1 Tax=Neonectria magnoliae TaxID=2732573 RepID=A0ABR1IEN8_9HYPO
MAPDPEPSKRRRGRPANASKPAGASLSRPDDYEADVDEVRLRKRGRSKATTDEPASQKRDTAAKEPEEPAPPKRKRGRPSLEDRRKAEEAAGAERQVEAEEDRPQEIRRSRRKPPKPAQEEQQQPEEQPEPTGAAPRRKRGRAAQSGQEPQQEEEEAEEEASQPQRKRGRPSLGILPNEDANNKGVKAARPRQKGQRPSDANTEDAENQDENQPKKRGRQTGTRNSTELKTKTASRPSRDGEQDQEQQDEQQEQPKAAPKRRGRRSHTAPLSDADSDAPPPPPKPYLHVAPQTRRIRASTIAAKWSPLSGDSLPAASALLALAHQPILQRTAATRQRRQHAEAALHLVARRVARKLARGLPFPPATGGKPAGRPFADADGGRAAQLDFESVLDGRAALERQLGPAVHAVELLRSEQQRMERELERDYETLRKLEASARAQTRERKEQMKKAHVLAPTTRPALQDTQDRSIITSSGPSGNIFKDMADPELQSLGLQLAGHVESIRGNLQQGEGIMPQLSRTRAALQGVLMRQLDQEAYEQVVLG